ncbi:hypothetical protein U14_03515 [Candidatus Moduliflexus flocculans]|uniref:Uncharacterized protein n=1 Tax=Candidatus Moduliflexus flocculans TaxID=1499966 RepID=A0A081BPE8_9BACT|nr:hypothetical protein U14_03515 [Candidatus Moduliflexus flocculans]
MVISKLDELVQKEKEIQNGLRKLVGDFKNTNSELEEISSSVNYELADLAYDGLPKLLEEQHHISLLGDLARDYMTDSEGRQIEVNIVGTATRDG